MSKATELYAAESDGWHSLKDGSLIGAPSTPDDLSGFTYVSSAGSNALTTIQTALNTHGTVALRPTTDGGAANYDCGGSLLWDSDMQLYVGEGVNLWRNFDSSNATTSGFLKNRSFSSPLTGCKLFGPGNIAARNNMGGNIISMWANGFISKDWGTSYYLRHTMIAGDDLHFSNHRWRVDTSVGSGGAGLRFAGGDNFLGEDLDIISGDDVFQCVPAGAANDPLFNVADTLGGMYVNCVGRSQSARVIAVGLQDSNGNGSTTLGMNVKIDGLMFRNIQGYGGGSAINIANHSSTGVLRNIKFDNVLVDQSQTLSSTQGQPGETYVQREGASCGAVSNIDFGGTIFTSDYTTGNHGVSVYNKRSAKDLTYISAPFGGVTNVTTAKSHAGNLGLVLS